MKSVLFILPFFLMVSFSKMPLFKETKTIQITPESSLEIKGTSNVTDFTCSYNILSLDQTISIHYERRSDRISFERSKMVLDNACFDCGGKGINKDFNALLQSDAYPQIVLNLKALKKIPKKSNRVDAVIEIEIAGLSKTYIMETSYHHNTDWLVSGTLKLNINDFKLEAPKKMMGLIVVSNEIEITFNLVVKEC